MLRVIGLLVLILIVWFAASSEHIANLKPYTERGIQLVQELAGTMRGRLERLKDDLQKLKQVEDENAVSEEPVGPFQNLIDQGVVNENFSERPWIASEGENSKGSIFQDEETFRNVHKENGQAEPREISDHYERARNRLFQAMAILEGK